MVIFNFFGDGLFCEHDKVKGIIPSFCLHKLVKIYNFSVIQIFLLLYLILCDIINVINKRKRLLKIFEKKS